MANSREQLVEKAQTEYGIVNAEDMSDTQLKSEMKAIDRQAKPEKSEDTAVKEDEKTTTDTTSDKK